MVSRDAALGMDTVRTEKCLGGGVRRETCLRKINYVVSTLITRRRSIPNLRSLGLIVKEPAVGLRAAMNCTLITSLSLGVRVSIIGQFMNKKKAHGDMIYQTTTLPLSHVSFERSYQWP